MKFFLFFILLFPILSRAESGTELEYAHSSLTSGDVAWNDVNIRNYIKSETDHQYVIETDYKNHFNQPAGVFGVTYTLTTNPTWYEDFSATASTNDTVLPGFVGFAQVHRKFLEDKTLVVGLGLGYVSSEAPYTDQNALLDAVYYLGSEWVVQGGVRVNRSSPGSVWTARTFAACTYYLTKKWDTTLKFEIGREGYTVIGISDFKNEFRSSELDAQFRYWINPDVAVKAGVEFYENEFYRRNGLTISFFRNY